MYKMKVQEQEKYFKELLSYGERINNDPNLVRDILHKHIEKIPNKKLYKFRTCSNQNFKLLEDNCIWMPPANQFKDTFDCSINIDLKANAKGINEWLKSNLSRYYFEFIKELYASKGLSIPLSYQDFKEYDDVCFSKNGDVLEDKEYEYLKKYCTKEELERYDAQMENLHMVRKQLELKMEEQYESLAPKMLEDINKMRSHMRDTMLTYCMTERFKNNNLWETYADNYKGYCIEYYFGDFEEKTFDDYKNLIYLLPIAYRRKIPYFDVVPFIDGAMKKQVLHEESFEHNPELIAKLNMQMFYKNKDYESEHEWRFSIKNKNNNKQPFPFVSAIYAGKDIKKRNLSRLINIARKLKVSIYQQQFNNAKNGYDYVPVKEDKNEL